MILGRSCAAFLAWRECLEQLELKGGEVQDLQIAILPSRFALHPKYAFVHLGWNPETEASL